MHLHSPWRLTALAFATTSFLVACGGGDNEDAVQRGSLVEAPATVTTLTAAQIDTSTASSGLQGLSGKAICRKIPLTAAIRANVPADCDGALFHALARASKYWQTASPILQGYP